MVMSLTQTALTPRLPHAQTVSQDYQIGAAEYRVLHAASQHPALCAAFNAHAAAYQRGERPDYHHGAMSALALQLASDLRRSYPITAHEFTVRGLAALYRASTGEPWTGPAPDPLLTERPIPLSLTDTVRVIGFGPRERDRPATVVQVSPEHAQVQEDGLEPWTYHLSGPLAGMEVGGRASLRVLRFPG